MPDGLQFNSPPVITAGEIWLIELDPESGLCPLDRAALAGANVVLYERALEPLVAAALPLGSYAEPLPDGGGAASAISPRALKFAAEGWSAVQLVAADGGWRARLQDAAAGFHAASDLPVRVIAKAAIDGFDSQDRCWHSIADVVDALGDGERLTLVVGPLATRYRAYGPAFTANGLAG